VTTGANLAGLASYGNYPYPYGVEATHDKFEKNEPNYNCDKIASDIVAQYSSEGYTFTTSPENVYRDGQEGGCIRGLLSGQGQTHVVDVVWNYNGSTYYHWLIVKLN
jgi:hypothetical protein